LNGSDKPFGFELSPHSALVSNARGLLAMLGFFRSFSRELDRSNKPFDFRLFLQSSSGKSLKSVDFLVDGEILGRRILEGMLTVVTDAEAERGVVFVLIIGLVSVFLVPTRLMARTAGILFGRVPTE